MITVRLLVLGSLLLTPSGPAEADWQIQIGRDATTGLMSRIAALTGTNGAALVEGCREEADGWWSYYSIILLPLQYFARPIERQIRYRIDDGPLREFKAPTENGIIRAPGGGGAEWMSTLTENGVRHLTIETEADSGSRFVSVFDLKFSGMEAARKRNQLRVDCFLKPAG